jgi:hypothetical protein
MEFLTGTIKILKVSKTQWALRVNSPGAEQSVICYPSMKNEAIAVGEAQSKQKTLFAEGVRASITWEP